tara:strand:+ start:370 stop:612 length:243 start_codon:yes stop_codon:yes gene_type:complete
MIKITQRDFNEEMFYVIYNGNMTESITVNPLLEDALKSLKEEGFEVPSYNENENYEEIPELKRLMKSFYKRFIKLTGYDL